VYDADASLSPVARHPIAELSARGTQAAVSVRPATGSVPAVRDAGPNDLVAWALRVPVSGPQMIVGGIALAMVGAALAWLNPLGLVGVAVFGAMMAVGGAAISMGMRKGAAATPALPPARSSDPHVVAERCRRVLAVLHRTGPVTFEGVQRRLRWTEAALVETLIALRDDGTVVEDLDLDSGEWTYRAAQDDFGQPMSKMLSDRKTGEGW
jgi:hypothetical protein